MSHLLLGLSLALVGSVALNASYLIQHAGSVAAPTIGFRHPVKTLGALLHSRMWLAGGVLGITGVAGHHGLSTALTSPWLIATIVASVAAFFCFQRALQSGRPMPVIALMTAGNNIVSIIGGLAVFGDPH